MSALFPEILYYKEAYYSKEEQESNDFKENIFNGEKNSETLDILLTLYFLNKGILISDLYLLWENIRS